MLFRSLLAEVPIIDLPDGAQCEELPGAPGAGAAWMPLGMRAPSRRERLSHRVQDEMAVMIFRGAMVLLELV